MASLDTETDVRAYTPLGAVTVTGALPVPIPVTTPWASTWTAFSLPEFQTMPSGFAAWSYQSVWETLFPG